MRVGPYIRRYLGRVRGILGTNFPRDAYIEMGACWYRGSCNTGGVMHWTRGDSAIAGYDLGSCGRLHAILRRCADCGEVIRCQILCVHPLNTRDVRI